MPRTPASLSSLDCSDVAAVRGCLESLDWRALHGFVVQSLAQRYPLHVTVGRTKSKTQGDTMGFGGFFPEDNGYMVVAVNRELLLRRKLWTPEEVALLIGDLYMLLLQDMLTQVTGAVTVPSSPKDIPHWVRERIEDRQRPRAR